MTVIARKESASVVAMPSNKVLRCMSYEDTLREMEAFLDGKLDNPRSTQDAYADITEPMSSNVTRVPDNEDPDATENSSSFDDTASRSENASGTSDAEVESEFRVDGGLASMLESYSSVFPMRLVSGLSIPYVIVWPIILVIFCFNLCFFFPPRLIICGT